MDPVTAFVLKHVATAAGAAIGKAVLKETGLGQDKVIDPAPTLKEIRDGMKQVMSGFSSLDGIASESSTFPESELRA